MKKLEKAVIIGAIVFFAFMVFPSEMLLSINNATSLPFDFDSKNIYTWQYSKLIGMYPFRDFWYPYAGRFYLSVPDFMGLMFNWIYLTSLFAVISYSIFVINKFKLFDTIWFLSVWAWLGINGIIQHGDRYYIALAVFLSFCSLIYHRSIPGFIVAIITGITCFVLEPNLLFLSLGSIFVFVILVALQSNRDANRRIIAVSIFYLVPLFVLSFIIVLLLYKYDVLFNALEFYTNLDLFSVSASWPLDWNLINSFSVDAILVYSISLLMFISTFYYIFPGNSFSSKDTAFCLSSAVLSFLLLQKYAIRPHIAYQIVFMPLFGLLFLFVRSLHGLNLYNFAFLYRLLPILLIVSLLSSGFNIITSKFGSIKYLASTNAFQEIKSFNILKNFTSANISINNINGDVFKREMILGFPDLPNNFFVLGDQPYLYMIFGSAPYRFITYYDVSAGPNQKSLIQQLKDKNPEYVLFDPSYVESDVVPNYIRTPVLYKYIIDNFKFEKNIYGIDVLKKMQYDEHVDFQYWGKYLPRTVNLGQLVSNLPKRKVIHNSCIDHRCDVYLNVSTLGSAGQVIVNFNSNNSGNYKVKFNVDSNSTSFLLKLNNLWFWDQKIKIGNVTLNDRPLEFSFQYLPSSYSTLY